MSQKRRSPIALSLVRNSKAAIISAIEIHNKPIFQYRYEIVVLLVLNSWELLLKGYIYKYLDKNWLFDKNKNSKSFEDCLNLVVNKLGKKYFPLKENLKNLYKYRCEVAHFYTEKLDIIIFGLLKQNIKFYSEFIRLHFNQDLNDNNDFVLLPLGFKKPYSPIDFITNKSTLHNSSSEIKGFIKSIIDSTRYLNSHSLDEPIIVDYGINLTNVNRVKNADIVAGIDNSINNSTIFTVHKESNKPKYILSNDTAKIKKTLNQELSSGIIFHEELSDSLFDEINNVIDANNILSNDKKSYLLGEQIYYKIYANREHVYTNPDNIRMLAEVCINKHYVPSLYWFSKLSPNNCAKIILKWRSNLKHPNANSFLSLILLLGNNLTHWLEPYLDKKFKKTQAPNYYYSFKDQLKKKKNIDVRLKALKLTLTSNIVLANSDRPVSLKELMNDDVTLNKALTNECIAAFGNNKDSRKTTRILDTLTYGLIINQKADRILEELNKLE